MTNLIDLRDLNEVSEKFLEYSILRDLMQSEVAQYVHWTADYRLSRLKTSKNVHAKRYWQRVSEMREIEQWFDCDTCPDGCEQLAKADCS